MLRKIIKIDESLCNGCGACAAACHEGAIEMVDGKAKLMREDYCDGLGDCLPACPTNAISFEMREAPAYNEEAVMLAKAKKESLESPGHGGHTCSGHGCPGSMAKTLKPAHSCPGSMAKSMTPSQPCPGSNVKKLTPAASGSNEAVAPVTSQLSQWPVQIKLVPVNAPYFDGANLLIAADCTAYAYGNFHQEFIRNRITLIGCPKLDDGSYFEKLTQIIANNNIKSVTIARMEVPCCGGLENDAKRALQASGKFIPWQVVTISTDGRILD